MRNRLFIIAGESSGDLYGAYLIKLIKQTAPQIGIEAWGGDKMQAAGATIKTHIKDLSLMGIVEVAKNIGNIQKLLKKCRNDISSFNPDAVIFIDYPGFNLRIAKWVKEQNIPTIQYISPKVWAWKESRIKTIRSVIDELICIFPFEIDFYKKHNLDVHYFGNPLGKLIKESLPTVIEKKTSLPTIGIMPGSRKQELARIMPVLVDFINQHKAHEFLIGQMPIIPEHLYLKNQLLNVNVQYIIDKPYDVIHSADVLINTSGTITLETLLLNKPQVVVYKAHALAYQVFKKLVKLNYISLPNIIAEKNMVKELLQDKCTVQNISKAVDDLINNPKQEDLQEIVKKLEVKDERMLVELLTKKKVT